MAKNGKRPRGRPRWDGPGDGRVRFSTRLKPTTIEFLREIGRGLANDGIEKLEEAFRDTMRRHGPPGPEVRAAEKKRYKLRGWDPRGE